MIRHQIARILGAIADRIEPNRPVDVQYVEYVYVYSTPPAMQPLPYRQNPWTSSPMTITCVN